MAKYAITNCRGVLPCPAATIKESMMKYTKREFEKLLKDKLTSECAATLDTASAEQIYRCLAMVTR